MKKEIVSDKRSAVAVRWTKKWEVVGSGPSGGFSLFLFLGFGLLESFQCSFGSVHSFHQTHTYRNCSTVFKFLQSSTKRFRILLRKIGARENQTEYLPLENKHVTVLSKHVKGHAYGQNKQKPCSYNSWKTNKSRTPRGMHKVRGTKF